MRAEEGPGRLTYLTAKAYKLHAEEGQGDYAKFWDDAEAHNSRDPVDEFVLTSSPWKSDIVSAVAPAMYYASKSICFQYENKRDETKQLCRTTHGGKCKRIGCRKAH